MAEAKKRAPRQRTASKPEPEAPEQRAEKRETAATTTRPADEVRVRFLCAVAGPGFRYRRKQVVTMSEERADVWCDGIRAERA